MYMPIWSVYTKEDVWKAWRNTLTSTYYERVSLPNRPIIPRNKMFDYGHMTTLWIRSDVMIRFDHIIMEPYTSFFCKTENKINGLISIHFADKNVNN